MTNSTPKIQYIPVEKIKLLAGNPRNISAENFEKLCNSIKKLPRYFEARPLLINDASGDLVVYGGNQRLRAAKKIGMKEVPAIVETLTPEEEKERTIRDNVELGDWDFEALANGWDLEQLAEWGVAIPNVEVLPGEGLTDPDSIPEIPKTPKTVRGDLYELGDHRLICGDSTVLADVEKVCPEKATMVFTDPPYNVDYGNIKHEKFKSREIQNDSMSSAEFRDFCLGWAGVIATTCDGIIYCWGAQGADGRIMFSVLDEMFHNSTTIIWNKDSMILGRGKYQNKYEPCWFGWNKNGGSFTSDRKLTNVWDFARNKKSKLHPTMKPVEVCRYAIEHSSKQSNTVLDVFGGSGSTMIACQQLQRKCRMVELDEKYCDVIVKRWLDFTGCPEFMLNGKKITRTEWES